MEESINKLLQSLKELNADNIIKEPQNENILYLAYIGDTIFEIASRDYLVRKYIDKLKIEKMHKMNVSLVCAKSQAYIIENLIDNEKLSNEEIEFYKHARNAHSNSKSKNSSIIEYRKATGLEALLGLLFYKDEKRLIDVLKEITLIFDKDESIE